MAQDCFLTFGICRQMIMMQPGKLSILPLESKQWGTGNLNRVVSQAVNLPLSVNSILFAASSDVGSGAFSLGTQVEDRTLKVYQSADQNPGGVLALIGYRYIAICQG